MHRPNLLRGVAAGAVWLVVLGLPFLSAADADDSLRTERDEARLQAVIEFADNVLKKGRDRFGKEPTPLFVDGVHVDTGEPVYWVYQGEEWIPSNLASQQNLFRTLVGLSNLTGQPRYEQAAREAIAYHFEHLSSPCGLLRWGGHRFIDLRSKRTVGEQNSHELKFNLPFYELMWDVDPAATEKFLKACWNAHVLVEQRFHHGFFLPSGDHANANFNAVEPLALLALDAMLRGTPEAVSQYNSGRGYIHGPHDGLGRTTDATAIWSRKRDR
jgi:hypothetical protein